jgi:cell division septum initiation protein DivIVA
LDEQEIVKAAGARAETIIERAQLEANRIKTEADDYVIAVLSQLETQLSSLLTTVRNGIKLVQEGRISPEDKQAEEKAEDIS